MYQRVAAIHRVMEGKQFPTSLVGTGCNSTHYMATASAAYCYSAIEADYAWEIFEEAPKYMDRIIMSKALFIALIKDAIELGMYLESDERMQEALLSLDAPDKDFTIITPSPEDIP